MRHCVVYPLTTHPLEPQLVSGPNLARFARAAERAGFAGISFTDHPAPSHKWLTAGGHDALDPFAALAYVAAATQRIRLIPNIVVLPYRNPFVVAKAAATVDALSGGRFVLSVATGYLRSEYRALGVDFDRRNEICDEALEVIRGIWSAGEYSFGSDRFVADRVTANPRPGHIPIWIGGNSARSRRRVARFGDAWNPFRASPELARTARTRPLDTVADLAPLVADLRRMLEEAGRDPSGIDVQFSTGLPGPGAPGFSAAAHLETLAAMAAAGVTWNGVTVPGRSIAAAIEAVEQFGAEVIAGSG